MRRSWRGVISSTWAACIQVNWRASTFVITSRRVIARTSRRTRRSMFSIARLYPIGRTSLNVYAADIPNVYDTSRPTFECRAARYASLSATGGGIMFKVEREIPILIGPTENLFLRGVFAPTSREITADDLQVEGEIPRDLFGIYLRNGPNPIFQPRDRYHWFYGDGMIHAIEFREGKATYRNRWITTQGFLAEQQARDLAGADGQAGRQCAARRGFRRMAQRYR